MLQETKKRSDRASWKLTDEQREFVLRRIAMYETAAEINQALAEAWPEDSLSLADSTISEYRHRQEDRIDQLRAEINTDLQREIPVASRVCRLRHYQKIIFDESNHLRDRLTALKQVREEVAPFEVKLLKEQSLIGTDPAELAKQAEKAIEKRRCRYKAAK